jgi:hypothetical protein
MMLPIAASLGPDSPPPWPPFAFLDLDPPEPPSAPRFLLAPPLGAGAGAGSGAAVPFIHMLPGGRCSRPSGLGGGLRPLPCPLAPFFLVPADTPNQTPGSHQLVCRNAEHR